MSDTTGNIGGILGVYVTTAVSLKAMDMVNRMGQNTRGRSSSSYRRKGRW